MPSKLRRIIASATDKGSGQLIGYKSFYANDAYAPYSAIRIEKLALTCDDGIAARNMQWLHGSVATYF